MASAAYWTSSSVSMTERRRAMTAEERLAERQRDLRLLRKKRLVREVAGPISQRLIRIVPVFFHQEGGYQVVTAERLGRELVGAVGARADLFTLLEKGEDDMR